MYAWGITDEKGHVIDEGFVFKADAERHAEEMNAQEDGHTYKVELLYL